MFRPSRSSLPVGGLLKSALAIGQNLLRWKPWRSSARASFGADSTRRPLLLLVLTAAIPIILFGLWASYLSAEKRRSDVRRDILERVGNVTESISAELQNNIEALQGLAVSSTLDREDLHWFYQEAVRLKAAHPLWHTVELADPSGAQVLNLLRPLGGELGPSAERQSFEKVVQTLQPAVSGIGPIGPVSGLQLVVLRVPIIRDKQLRYVLSIALEPKAVDLILREAGVPPGWIGGVVDARGNIVARTTDEGFKIGRPASEAARQALVIAPGGFYRGKTLEGIEVDVAYRFLPHTDGWSVHFGISSDLLNAPVEQSQYLLAGGAAISLALAALLSILVARDIAQRRGDERLRAKRVLQASEEHRAMAIEAAALGTWRWNPDLDRLEISNRAGQLFGLSQSSDDSITAWRYRHVMEAIHPDDLPLMEKAVRQCLESDLPIEVEFRTLRKDGSAHWVRVIGRCQRIDQGGPKFVQGVIADIDLRKRADARHVALLRRLAQAQEDERQHIARDLHDQVGQTVTGLALGLKGLEQAIERNGKDQLTERVHWLRRLTSDIGRDLHRAAANLRPTALDDLGLEKALSTYAADWSDRYGVSIDIQSLGIGDRLPAEIETVVYRVILEGLTNVLKHAAASAVSILLERRGQFLRVIIEDNGQGFDPAELPADNVTAASESLPRLGLSGIRERLSLVGGTMAIESTRGVGTTLYIQIPAMPPEQRSISWPSSV
jgi:two-component system, NarL family, sensor histidine kinase UhpB